MLSEHKISNEQAKSLASNAEISELEMSNSKFGLGVIMTMAGFIGAWGCLCLVNGLTQSQSIQELGRGIITAFTGI